MARLLKTTVAQAVIRFLSVQHSEMDGEQERLVTRMFGIFGHGNVAGIGEGLDEYGAGLPFYQTKNEQSSVHAAIGYAKARNRRATCACTASSGPGSTNMLTGAATATINRVPVLLLPSDYFAARRPGNVLQQVEHPLEADVSVNDAFRPLSAFFDRISRPEQVFESLPEAMRVLTDPAATGAVTISLPQDVQGEAVEFPAAFLAPRVWSIRRPAPTAHEIARAAELLSSARRPLIIAGGGVRYSGAEAELLALSRRFGIPVSETNAGRGITDGGDLMLGGQGLNGTRAAAHVSETADVILCIGTRLTDFMTASRSAFKNPDVRFIGLNVNGRDACKLSATPIVADAREGLRALHAALEARGFSTGDDYVAEVRAAITSWRQLYGEAVAARTDAPMEQIVVYSAVNEAASEGDVVIAAAGTAPGEFQRGWDSASPAQLFLEFGNSCMGHEIPAGLGVRLARPDTGEVFVVIGDGTYLMNPSELVTAVQERLKITVVLIDNHGYQCIRELQHATTGNENFGNEFRYRENGADHPNGDYVEVDYAANAASMGCATVEVDSAEALRQALADSRTAKGPVVIVVKVRPRGTGGAHSGLWWDVGVADVTSSARVREAAEAFARGRVHQRILS